MVKTTTNNYLLNFNNNKIIIYEWIIILNSLIKTYIYLYMHGKFNIKILFLNEYINLAFFVKESALISNNYYYNNKVYPGMLININMLKKHVLILRWLEKILLLKLPNLLYKKLYVLYVKFYIKFEGLKNIKLPIKSILFLNLTNKNTLFSELKKTNNVAKIIIGKINTKKLRYEIIIPYNNKKINFYYKILGIFTAALLHNKLFI